MKKNILLLFSLSVFINLGFSQTIAAWDFNGESSPVSSSADVWNSNLDGSNLVVRGSGAVASTATNSFRTQGFQNNGILLSNTDYFEHTLSAVSGYTLSLTSINGYFAGTTTFSAAPGVSMQFAYSLDGTNFTLIGTPFTRIGNGPMTSPIDLTGISNLQNVPDNVTVTFRFYASGQTMTGGWGYNSPSAGTYGISFGGSLNCLTQTTFYADADGDTFGNPTSTIQACTAPAGYVSNNTDCDDSNALINPNTIWYADMDGDGFGNLNATSVGCVFPMNFVLNSTDCDDANFNANVLTTFYQDFDGDGFGNPAISISNCGQPAGYVANNTDCDDSNATINSSATEIADNIDNDCDGLTDEGFAILTWYLDNDLDSFGGTDSLQSILSPGANYVLTDGDCNDANASINPNAIEICDSIDNNCDGLIDNGLTFLTYYVDADGDTYGSTNDSIAACSQPTGYVLNNTDCDDSNASINPGAADVPVNGIDEDCNGSDAPLVPLQLGIYEFTQPSSCPVTATSVTTQPSTATFSVFSSNGVDCQAAGNVFNNSNWNTTSTIDINEYVEFSITANQCQILNLDRIAFNHRCSATGGTPTWYVRSSLDNYATDLGSGLSANNNNQNLDDTVMLGTAFEAISTVTFRFYITGIGTTGATFRFDNVSLYGNSITLQNQTYYSDLDSDGFGDLNSDTLACSMPVGYVLDNTDCNDQDSLINPMSIWYIDSDNDLIGDSSNSFIGCVPPSGYVLSAGDCDDTNPQIYGPVIYFLDSDGDSFGVDSTAQTLCQNPGVGYVTLGGDCDDGNASINPNATEICDGIDNNCDGLSDNGLVFAMYYVDEDGDGFGDVATGVESCSQPQNTITVGGDCDDANDQIYPGATEICDAVDNDCDGSTDEGLTFITYYSDFDNDGFGTGSTGLSFCENPGPGFSTNNLDCNDANGQINPNATDILDNGIDENCDGVDGYLGIQVISDIKVMVSPNPNLGSFTIEFNQLVANAVINLTDLNGKVVRVYQLSGDSIQISDSNLEKGVYLLNVSTQGNTLIERIVVQ